MQENSINWTYALKKEDSLFALAQSMIILAPHFTGCHTIYMPTVVSCNRGMLILFFTMLKSPSPSPLLTRQDEATKI